MSSTAVIAAPKANDNTLVQEIPLDRIQPSPNNPRESMDSQALSELTEPIKTHGVLQPILVRPVPYEIICVMFLKRLCACRAN
jgi:ParB/RepB/Spo0J family partition protein